MKGTTGVLFVGVLLGAIAALLAVKLKNDGAPESVDAIADRIKTNLEELETRIESVVARP